MSGGAATISRGKGAWRPLALPGTAEQAQEATPAAQSKQLPPGGCSNENRLSRWAQAL